MVISKEEFIVKCQRLHHDEKIKLVRNRLHLGTLFHSEDKIHGFEKNLDDKPRRNISAGVTE